MGEWWPFSHIFVVPNAEAQEHVCENVGKKSSVEGVFLLPRQRQKKQKITSAVFGKGGEPVLVTCNTSVRCESAKIYFLNCAPPKLEANMIVLNWSSPTTVPLQELLGISHADALVLLENTRAPALQEQEVLLCAWDWCGESASSHICGTCGKAYCSTICMMQGCKDCNSFLIF